MKIKVNCKWWVKVQTSSKWDKFRLWSKISPQNNRGIKAKVFCIFGPNLVILAWTDPELSHGQASDWHTDRHTHTQTQAMTIPKGQNWPRVKMTNLRGWKHNLRYSLELTNHNSSAHFSWDAGIILQMCPANEIWHCIVTSSLIGWATQNYPWGCTVYGSISELS